MKPATTLEDVNAALTTRLRQQELSAELANFSLRTPALQLVLNEACRVAAQGMGCSFAKVLEYLPDENRFLLRAGLGWRPGLVGHAKLDADLESPAGYAFRTAQPVLSNHLETETRFHTPQLLRDHGIDRAFNVLIRMQNTPYGVLEVDSPDGAEFTATDIAFMEMLAATLSNAITSCKRTADLERSTTFIERVLEASPDCVKVLDREGRIERINLNGLDLLELDGPDQAMGKVWFDFWPQDQQGMVRAQFRAALTGQTRRFDAHAPTAKGTPRWWEIHLAPLAYQNGEPTQVLSLSRNITERMEANQAKDLLMLEIHHRVKNSLQLVQNLLNLQSRAADDDVTCNQLAESAARVRTISAIHDQLYQTGAGLTVEVGPYLEALVADLQRAMASTLEDRPIRVQSAAASWAAADMSTLGLVLTELVTNALKYGKGAITITFTQPDDGGATLTVCDEGTGLPADFDPANMRGLGMRLINGLLRGDSAGLQVDRSKSHTCFVAHLPPSRGHTA